MQEKMVVHDPRGFAPKVTGKRLAPRLESLDWNHTPMLVMRSSVTA